MIVELFGPPGSGKTTFAHALAQRLRGSGFNATVVLSHQPSTRTDVIDSIGFGLFIFRIISSILTTVKILLSPRGRENDLELSLSMVRLIAPEKVIWRARLWQYILHLSHCWEKAKQSPDIIIFDQGYVQAVGSLAIFNGATDVALLAKALKLAPKSDVAIRVVLPPGDVETRLRQRIRDERPAERILEADVDVNMRSVRIFEHIDEILAQSDRSKLSVSTIDMKTMLRGVRHIEKAIISRFQQHRGNASAKEHRACDSIGVGTVEPSPSRVAAAGNLAATKPAESKDETGSTAKRKEDAGRNLAHASVFALVIYIGGAGLTSLAQFAIARLVGSTSYGIYAYAMAWTSVLAYLSTLGFNISLLRFVPAYRATGQLDLARGVIRFALQRSLSAATLAAGAGAILIWMLADPSQAELEIAMLLGMASVPLITAYALGATLTRAFGGIISALLPERIVRDGLLLILLIIAATFGHWSLGAPLVMATAVASSAATAAMVFVTAARLTPTDIQQADVASAKGQWWAAVPPIMLFTGLDVFVNRTGIMVLGWSGHIQEAGIFALGLNVAMLVGLSRIAVSTMFSPTAADFHARAEQTALQNLFARATVLCLIGAVCMAVPLLLIVEPLLSWFGEDFVAGAPIARILILGYLFTAMFGPQQNLLMMTGNEWGAVTTMVTGAIVNVAACAVGMALHGSVGAAAGFALSLVVWNVAMAVQIRRRLDILPGLFSALLGRAGVVRRPS